MLDVHPAAGGWQVAATFPLIDTQSPISSIQYRVKKMSWVEHCRIHWFQSCFFRISFWDSVQYSLQHWGKKLKQELRELGTESKSLWRSCDTFNSEKHENRCLKCLRKLKWAGSSPNRSGILYRSLWHYWNLVKCLEMSSQTTFDVTSAPQTTFALMGFYISS